MPFLVGWLAEIVAIRYGGLWLYPNTIPRAIGFIDGDLVDQFVWGLVQAVVRSRGGARGPGIASRAASLLSAPAAALPSLPAGDNLLAGGATVE